jgi:hypothetical protein
MASQIQLVPAATAEIQRPGRRRRTAGTLPDGRRRAPLGLPPDGRRTYRQAAVAPGRRVATESGHRSDEARGIWRV